MAQALAAMPVSASYLLSGQLHKGLQQVNQTLKLIKAGIEGVEVGSDVSNSWRLPPVLFPECLQI